MFNNKPAGYGSFQPSGILISKAFGCGKLRETKVFSICLVAIVLELFTAAGLLANKGWILQYYLAAGEQTSWRGRRKVAEFLPAIGETGITQRDCCSYVIVPKCVTTQAPQGFFEGVTHRHWWLFALRCQKKCGSVLQTRAAGHQNEMHMIQRYLALGGKTERPLAEPHTETFKHNISVVIKRFYTFYHFFYCGVTCISDWLHSCFTHFFK